LRGALHARLRRTRRRRISNICNEKAGTFGVMPWDEIGGGWRMGASDGEKAIKRPYEGGEKAMWRQQSGSGGGRQSSDVCLCTVAEYSV